MDVPIASGFSPAESAGTGILSTSHLEPSAGQVLGAPLNDATEEAVHEDARPDKDEREAAVMAAHRRGDDVATIAAKLKIGKSTIYRYLRKHEPPSI